MQKKVTFLFSVRDATVTRYRITPPMPLKTAAHFFYSVTPMTHRRATAVVDNTIGAIPGQ